MYRKIILLFLAFFSFYASATIENSQENVESENQYIIPSDKIEYISPTFIPNDIPLIDINEKEFLPSSIDNKLVLLHFWATWCAECVGEMKKLDVMAADFKNLPITIISASVDFQGLEHIKNFYKQNNINHLEIYHDKGNLFYNALGVRSIPFGVLIMPNGKYEIVFKGEVDWDNEDVRQFLLNKMPGKPERPRNSSRNNLLQKISPAKTKLDKKDLQEQSNHKLKEEKKESTDDGKASKPTNPTSKQATKEYTGPAAK